MAKVWVYAEVGPDGPHPASLELLTKARSVADTVEAVALGPGATQAAAALGDHGAQTVLPPTTRSTPSTWPSRRPTRWSA